MDLPSLSAFVTGAGSTGLIGVALYLIKLALDARRDHRDDVRTDKSSAVTDAATANATLVKTVETLQLENVRMAKKITHLEDEAEIKDRKIDDLGRRIEAIATELSELKTGH